MPYARASLSTLRAQVMSDIQSSLDGTDPLLRFSNLGIVGVSLANLASAMYGYLDWIAKQSVPFTCTDEFLYGWGALKNVIPIPAEPATNGLVTFSGSPGSVLPSETLISRSDGVQYVTQESGTVGIDGTVTVGASAEVSGAISNSAVGTVMSLGESIVGIGSTGTVTTAFTNGLDPETQESYRTRMLQVYQNPPQGGAAADYVTWALNNTNGIVTRAWAKGMGLGSVVLYVMMDVTEAEHDGFPQGTDGCATSESRAATATGDQLIVADFLYPLRPVTALLYVVSPIANAIDFTISGLGETSSATRAAVEEAIRTTFYQHGSPLGDVTELSYLEAAIAAVPGTTGFVITSPSGNIVSALGYLPTLGTVTYA